jgi:hypothetical protein
MKFRKYYPHLLVLSFILIVIIFQQNYASRKKYVIKKSPIHGVGVFASETIQKGEIIECMILMGQKRLITPYFGSLVNHSNKKNNIEIIRLKDHYYAIATTAILKNTEIMIDYDGPTIPAFIQGSKPHFI